MPLYLCDPDKNQGCRKTACVHNPNAKYHRCEATTSPAFAKLDENGRPILLPDLREKIKGQGPALSDP